ncbi:hypothetical protein CTAYLR_006739 [Chrysophaeum taylorii]|uniref:BZIP domain-containing protein n=1 Tax=Chrysophaeum taylorii TaxID=2483200 RepID=A0AAD7UDI7_9STRA|nr:hypothetical protein CTAYLR_006739 [Chrysophaeum taylorii]
MAEAAEMKEDDEEEEEEEKPDGTNREAQDEYESKRRKRLELNRKAAQESRRRKKLRIEELQRSVVFLTRENSELREQNELLRQMLASEMPVEANTTVDRFQAENTALKLALYESVQNLTKHKQGLMGSVGTSTSSAAPVTAGMSTTGAPMNGIPLSGMPAALPVPGVMSPQGGGVPNMASMMDALSASRVAMPHMMGLTPAMLMARQQSAAAMLGMANAPDAFRPPDTTAAAAPAVAHAPQPPTTGVLPVQPPAPPADAKTEERPAIRPSSPV